MSVDGSLQTYKDAKKEGLVDFVGITGHKPWVLAKAIETGEFDTVLVPINVVTRQALEELLPTAKAHDVGVVAMKPLSAKTSNLITCLYQPSLSLVSQEPELKALLGETADQQVTSALCYILGQDVSTVIPGLRSIHEVEVAANAGDTYRGLTPEEEKQFTFNLGDYCRDCGRCMPCQQKVNIPAVLRFQSFQETFGIKEWAKKLYGGLEVKADKCTGCGECEAKCPYKLQIVEKLKKVHFDFSDKPA
jgi:predicted aldo/keto reductase-like oxidoreductase